MAGNNVSNALSNQNLEPLRNSGGGARSAPARASVQAQDASTVRQSATEAKQPAATSVAPASSSEDLGRTVQELNELAQAVRREIRFSVDDSTGRTVINVLDAETEELVRQIPSEEVLAVAARLKDEADSVLVDAQA